MFAVPVPPPDSTTSGVERALDEEPDGVAVLLVRLRDEVGLRLLERADELATDDLALLLGVAHAGERVEEPLAGVDRDEAHARRGDVVLLDLATLALAHEAVVHEDADELIAHRLVDESGGHGGVDAARERAEDLARPHLSADPLHLVGDDVARVPVGRDTGPAVQEVLDDALTVGGVLHFGVPLHAVEAALVVGERGDGGRGGRGEHLEPLGRRCHRVTVAHPHGLVGGLVVQQRPTVDRDVRVGGAVLPSAGACDRASEGRCHHLEAVADAERGDPEIEDLGVERRSTFFVDARGAPGEDDAHGVLLGDLGGRDRVRHDLGVHAGLAHTARDELRVLRSEIDDEDGPGPLGQFAHAVGAFAFCVDAAERRSR
jgi:hypothetical protein